MKKAERKEKSQRFGAALEVILDEFEDLAGREALRLGISGNLAQEQLVRNGTLDTLVARHLPLQYDYYVDLKVRISSWSRLVFLIL